MALAVHLRQVVALSGRFPLLSGVTLDIEEGDVVHLRGPNGAGKTSLLRLLAGLVAPSAGDAVVLGHDLFNDRMDLRRDVGLFGHEGFLYDDLTVRDNLTFAVRAARRPRGQVKAAMERLELSGRVASTKVGHLSAGQRRRCALAVLFAKSPRLWLLDEPHAGLDATARANLEAIVAEAAGNGSTVVLSSHEIARAGELSDLVVELAGGEVRSLRSLRGAMAKRRGRLAPLATPNAEAHRAGSDVA